jgi:threonine/homoserine/homoserine lactone efflux protein
MLYYSIVGMTYAFAAAIQPGPLQSFLLSRSLSHGWRKTLPAACAPLISDGPILVLVLFVLSVIPAWLIILLQCAGGIFLFYLAFQAYRAWKDFKKDTLIAAQSSRASVMQAVAVNFLNPAPYLGWSLVMGPLLLQGWREHPINGIALLVGFYTTIVLCQMCLIVIFSFAKKFGPLVVRISLGVSAMALAFFDLYQLWLGGSYLWKTF